MGDTQTDTHRQTDRQTGDLRSLLSFLESRLKIGYSFSKIVSSDFLALTSKGKLFLAQGMSTV
jgi:hypothetical protein